MPHVRSTLALAVAFCTAAQRPVPSPVRPPASRAKPARPVAVRRAPAATDTAAGTAVGIAAPAGALGDPTTGAALDSLVTIFRGDVTTLPPATALRLVETWQGRLSASGDEQLADLAVDLGALRATLAAPPVDSAVVATLLSRLAPKVTAAAPKAGDRAAQLRALGEAIDRTAARLRAGAR